MLNVFRAAVICLFVTSCNAQTLYPLEGKQGADVRITQAKATANGATTPSLTLNDVKVTTLKDFYGTGAATVTTNTAIVIVNVPTGAGITTPSLQQVTDVGNTTSRDVYISGTLLIGVPPNTLNTISLGQGLFQYNLDSAYFVMNHPLNIDAGGTTPFVINSTNRVANLNADMVDGYHASGLLTTDTLQSVTDRGNTTTNDVKVSGGSFKGVGSATSVILGSASDAGTATIGDVEFGTTDTIGPSFGFSGVPTFSWKNYSSLGAFEFNRPIFADSSIAAGDGVFATYFNSSPSGVVEPYQTSSNQLNVNLNADLLDGYHAADLLSTATTPNLQQVTDVGHTTTQPIGTSSTLTASGNIQGGSNGTFGGIVRGGQLATSGTLTVSGQSQFASTMDAAGLTAASSNLADNQYVLMRNGSEILILDLTALSSYDPDQDQVLVHDNSKTLDWVTGWTGDINPGDTIHVSKGVITGVN